MSLHFWNNEALFAWKWRHVRGQSLIMLGPFEFKFYHSNVCGCVPSIISFWVLMDGSYCGSSMFYTCVTFKAHYFPDSLPSVYCPSKRQTNVTIVTCALLMFSFEAVSYLDKFEKSQELVVADLAFRILFSVFFICQPKSRCGFCCYYSLVTFWKHDMGS